MLHSAKHEILNATTCKYETRNVEIPRKPGFPTAAAIKNMDHGR